jgi:hypothetical protein
MCVLIRTLRTVQLEEVVVAFEGEKQGLKWLIVAKVRIVGPNILFPTELHLKNVNYLYSACSNPTNVVLLIALSIIIGKGA